MAEVGAAIEARQVEREVELADVTPHQHVEQPVVRLGLRADLDAAAESAAVGADHVVGDQLERRLVVDLDAERHVAPGRERGDGRKQERGRSAESLRRALERARPPPGEAAGADVDVPARARAGRARRERRTPEVDRARAPAAQQLQCPLRLLGDAVGANRVAPGAEGQDRQLGAGGAARREAVDDLVDGAVAAERADELAPLLGGRACELRGMSRRLGEHGLQLEAEGAGALREARPALSGRAVLRGRVDDHIRAGRQCFGSESAARIASSVMRATAALSSSSVMRTNSPAMMMSETVSRQAAWIRAQGRDREEDRGLHLDAQHAPVGPALRAARVGVVERARRHARPDAQLRAVVLGLVDGRVHELEVGGRARAARRRCRSASCRRWGRPRSRG